MSNTAKGFLGTTPYVRLFKIFGDAVHLLQVTISEYLCSFALFPAGASLISAFSLVVVSVGKLHNLDEFQCTMSKTSWQKVNQFTGNSLRYGILTNSDRWLWGDLRQPKLPSGGPLSWAGHRHHHLRILSQDQLTNDSMSLLRREVIVGERTGHG